MEFAFFLHFIILAIPIMGDYRVEDTTNFYR